MTSRLPTLPPLNGPSQAVSGALTPDAVNLFRAYEVWLNGIKPRLGKNSQIFAKSPVKTLEGIRLEIANTSGGCGTDFLSVLESFSRGCIAKGWIDDETGKVTYFVNVPWPEGHQDDYYDSGEGGGGGAVSSSSGKRPLLPWGWTDEPKILIGGIILSSLTASYTTNWVQWKNLAVLLGALAGLG